jgi:dUTP pyrophosphatase
MQEQNQQNQNNDSDEFIDKQLSELERVIQSANQLLHGLNGGINMNDILSHLPQQQTIQQPIVKTENPSALLSGLILHFINKSTNPDPKFEHDGDSGFDLRANLEQPVIIPVGKMKCIPTGLYFEVSKGYEIQERSRSGLARDKQVFVINQPATIDSCNRGEIFVMLINLGENDIQITHGDRIAQGVVCPVVGSGLLTLMKTDQLSPSSRDTNGFGSTGIK